METVPVVFLHPQRPQECLTPHGTTRVLLMKQRPEGRIRAFSVSPENLPSCPLPTLSSLVPHLSLPLPPLISFSSGFLCLFESMLPGLVTQLPTHAGPHRVARDHGNVLVQRLGYMTYFLWQLERERPCETQILTLRYTARTSETVWW